jgi:adenylate cyclase class IV
MQNLELKCRSGDLAEAARLACNLGARLDGEFSQTDTYFAIRTGRLKLRHTIPVADASVTPAWERYELIFYRREDRREAKTSDYLILPVADGPAVLAFLSVALGVKVTVDKKRVVYLKDNLRIHLDSVPGLGNFLEFELIVKDAHPLPQCQEQMQHLVRHFRIVKRQLVTRSYSDLLLARQRHGRS